MSVGRIRVEGPELPASRIDFAAVRKYRLPSSKRDSGVKELLVTTSEIAVAVIDAMALLIIVVGTVGAFVQTLKVWFSRVTEHDRRNVWLKYARWLVAGLTFQLAADIIESSIATDWDSVGRLAAIAVIRTFLNYFLERDVADLRERQRQDSDGPSAST